jgi:hypothetical protein
VRNEHIVRSKDVSTGRSTLLHDEYLFVLSAAISYPSALLSQQTADRSKLETTTKGAMRPKAGSIFASLRLCVVMYRPNTLLLSISLLTTIYKNVMLYLREVTSDNQNSDK